MIGNNHFRIFKALITVAIIFQGCSGNKVAISVPTKPIPAWYINPPQSDKQVLYEVAEGISKEDAINKALNFMASSLSVTIASEYKSHETKRSSGIETYRQEIENTVQAKVKATRISHYQVQESQEYGFRRYFVLVKSDKAQLFASMKKELDEKITLLNSYEKNIKNKNVIEQLRFYKQAELDVSGFEHTLNVMHVLNKEFDSAPYLQATSNYKNSYNDIRAKITFSFQSNIEGKNLIEPIMTGLSSKQLLIENRNDPYHLYVSVEARMEQAESMGFYLARTALSITTKNKEKTIIGSNNINLTGQSTQGYSIAKENVAIQLQQLIEEAGINSVLGLNL